jgi:hypothetical protein
VGIKMMHLLSECIVWFACIFGVCGNIGQKRVEKEVNAHVMVPCMIQ